MHICCIVHLVTLVLIHELIRIRDHIPQLMLMVCDLMYIADRIVNNDIFSFYIYMRSVCVQLIQLFIEFSIIKICCDNEEFVSAIAV